ncbi:MAG: C39 family peptidase, partial [bacterium]
MRKVSVLVIIIVIGVVAWFGRGWFRDLWNDWQAPDVPVAVNRSQVVNVNVNASVNTSVNSTVNNNLNVDIQPEFLPDEINLDVPFTSQAPHANWDLPYQEACEEAAALMVHRYWTDRPFASKEDADLAILELVNFQETNYGFYQDTTGEQTARFIRDKWDYQTEVYTGDEVTLDLIKQNVAQGRPVIVLAAGRMLGNPNFTSPGPIYHALVVKGYRADGLIITNDPGTRNGADYIYEPDVLMNAIH